jgi:hypothetical protein
MVLGCALGEDIGTFTPPLPLFHFPAKVRCTVSFVRCSCSSHDVLTHRRLKTRPAS